MNEDHANLPPLQPVVGAAVEITSTGADTRSPRRAPLWLLGLLIATVLVSAAVVYWLIVRPSVLTTAPLMASTLNDVIEPVAPPPEETRKTAPALSTAEFIVESATSAGANNSLPDLDLVAAGPAEPGLATPDTTLATTAAAEPVWSDALQSHADAASAQIEAMEQRILKLEQRIAGMAGEHERLKERLKQGLEQPAERPVTRPQPPSPTVRSIRILNGSAQARLVFDKGPVLMEEGQEYQGWTLAAVNWPAGSVTVAHAASGVTQVLPL